MCIRDREETGEDIPISAIYHMARKFSVDLTEILTGTAPKLDTYHLVRRGETEAVSYTHLDVYKRQAEYQRGGGADSRSAGGHGPHVAGDGRGHGPVDGGIRRTSCLLYTSRCV